MRRRLFLLAGLCLTLSCERADPADAIQIPPTATRYVTAARLEHLAVFDDVPALDGFEHDAPGWMFCDGGTCTLGGRRDDGEPRVITWSSNAASGASGARGEGAQPPLPTEHTGTSAFQGRLDPAWLLRHAELEDPRAVQLLERAKHQVGTVEFDAELRGDDLRATAHLVPNRGEPRFVTGLGVAEGDFPDIGGLIAPDSVAVLRFSADPEAIAALVHSTFSAQRRGAIDGFVAGLRTAYGLDLQRDVLDHITGHFAVVAYAASPDKTPSQWLTGAATEEAVFISLADAAPIGRFLDAATQLTRGTLRVQRVDGARTQWAWIADDVVRWTFILGPDYLLVVDGPSSLEHARRFQSEPSVPLPHDERGLDDLLSGNARSGFYLTRAALRALPGGTALFDDFDWVTIVADEAGAEELVRIDIGGFNKH